MPGGKEAIEKFAEHYYNTAESLLIVSEHNTGSAAIQEAFHLAALTGKLGKTASGILVLKEKNNAQGLFDMGVTPHAGVGGVPLSNAAYQANLKKVWQVENLPVEEADLIEILDQGQIKHLYIAGEDPLGCAKDKDRTERWFAEAEFVMVQDYFLTETAKRAHLILPASFPIEADGSFTNAQRNIQVFEKQLKGAVDIVALNQWLGILRSIGEEQSNSADEVREELLSLLLEQESELFAFQTNVSECPGMFDYGADYLHKSFELQFSQEHKQALEMVRKIGVEEHEKAEI